MEFTFWVFLPHGNYLECCLDTTICLMENQFQVLLFRDIQISQEIPCRKSWLPVDFRIIIIEHWGNTFPSNQDLRCLFRSTIVLGRALSWPVRLMQGRMRWLGVFIWDFGGERSVIVWQRAAWTALLRWSLAVLKRVWNQKRTSPLFHCLIRVEVAQDTTFKLGK